MTAYKRKRDFGGKDHLFHFRPGKVWEPFLFLVVLLLAVAVVGTATALGSNVINNEKNAVFADKWHYSVGVLLMAMFLFARGQESKHPLPI